MGRVVFGPLYSHSKKDSVQGLNAKGKKAHLQI